MDYAAPFRGLPHARTALIGRERELGELRGFLLDTDTRLLTLTGVGGSGKTRLAVQLVSELAPRYPQRAWVADLAPVVDPDLVPIIVADALGLHEAGSTSSTGALTAHIGARPALLFLDNCEHLIDACAMLVDALLGACPELRVVVTSREPLQIAGEQQFRVPPLEAPAPDGGGDMREIAASPAVRLFVARAQAVLPAFDLTPGNAATVAGICARLEGIPLALELAAARVQLLGMEQILATLDDSFRLLTGGSRVAPTRHQTLRAALEWGDTLLSEAERAVFRRLAVFAGEFRIEAAEELCWRDDRCLQPDQRPDQLRRGAAGQAADARAGGPDHRCGRAYPCRARLRVAIVSGRRQGASACGAPCRLRQLGAYKQGERRCDGCSNGHGLSADPGELRLRRPVERSRASKASPRVVGAGSYASVMRG